MLPMLLHALALTTFLLFAIPIAALVNVTIDDSLGDSRSTLVPEYTPSDKWAQGEECSGCFLHPGIVKVSHTFDHTWHDATYQPGQPDLVVSLTFNGVAIYVFNIVPNSVPGATTLTNLSFFLDHEYVGQFIHVPDKTTNIAYHVPVYINESLPDAQHFLDIHATGPNASLILFDYAIYSSTMDDSSSTSPSSTFTSSSSTLTSSSPTLTSSSPTSSSSSTFMSSPTSAERGRIIGGVVGGVVGFIALLVLVFIFRRRSRKPHWDTQHGDLVETIGAGVVYIPILHHSEHELRPPPYDPPLLKPAVASSSMDAATRRIDGKGKGCDAFDMGTRNEAPSQPPWGTLPNVSATGHSGLNVLEDLAASRQDIARTWEQQIVRHRASLPPPYDAEGHEGQ